LSIARRSRACRATAIDDGGFTVVEVIISFVLFMILAASAGLALSGTLRASQQNEARVVAANLVQRQVETIRGLAADEVEDGDAVTRTVIIDGRRFYLDQTTTLDTVGGSGSACSGASGPAAFKRVTVTVSWDGIGDVAPVRSDTLKALPVTGLDAGTGVLSVPVQDRDGDGVSGITLALNTGETARTKSDGCAVFTGVAPGTAYTVTASSSGYVDRDGNVTASQAPVAVYDGEVSKQPALVYDEAATLAIGVLGPSGYALPDGLGVSLGNAYLSGGQRAYPLCGATTTGCATGTSASMEIGGLFPFSDGYSVWPGTCLGARPVVTSAAAVEGGSTASVTASPAGGVAAVAMRGSAYVPGTTLWAVNSACTTSERFQFSGTTGDGPSGALTMALPQGTWTIYAGSTPESAVASTSVSISSGQIANGGTPVVVMLP
jgi:type II secretory pathway pseudopilin PulG